MAMRREVPGDSYVEPANAKTTISPKTSSALAAAGLLLLSN
jgi:hypothetical protein